MLDGNRSSGYLVGPLRRPCFLNVRARLCEGGGLVRHRGQPALLSRRRVISTMARLGDLSTGRVRVGRTVGATEGAVAPTRRY